MKIKNILIRLFAVSLVLLLLSASIHAQTGTRGGFLDSTFFDCDCSETSATPPTHTSASPPHCWPCKMIVKDADGANHWLTTRQTDDALSP